MSSAPNQRPLLLYDAHCGFCTGWANWLQGFTGGESLDYASLQSAQGQETLQEYGFPPQYRNSLVLTWQGKALTEGRALRILVGLLPLGWFWQIWLKLCPLVLINGAYRFVARHRKTMNCNL